jgi:hypothetical protein
MAIRPQNNLARCAGEVVERSDTGEGAFARTTLTRLISFADLSRNAGEVN